MLKELDISLDRCYLACMQVPAVNHLFQDVSRSKRLMNGFDNLKHASFCNLTKSSHSKFVKYLKLKWRKLECSVSEIGGAANIFSELFGSHHADNTFWLDSSSTEMVSFFFLFFSSVVLLTYYAYIYHLL